MEPRYKAFMSYTRFDDQHEGGRLTRLRERLSEKIQSLTGEPFPIFQDIEDITLGQHFEKKIDEALRTATFLIPIITPSFFKSNYCREELCLFIQREAAFDRKDLVLPVYYIECSELEDPTSYPDDELVQTLAARQRSNWCTLNHASFHNPKVKKALHDIAVQIRDALKRLPPDISTQQNVTKFRGVTVSKNRLFEEDTFSRIFTRNDRDDNKAGTVTVIKQAKYELCSMGTSLQKMLCSTNPEIRRAIDDRLNSGCVFNLLMADPDNSNLALFNDYLGTEQINKPNQQRVTECLTGYQDLKTRYNSSQDKNFNLRLMQGALPPFRLIIVDRDQPYAFCRVELYFYRKDAGSRPSLLIYKKDQPEIFQLFCEQFDTFWEGAKEI